ncbi:MAG: ribosomal RNA small subunit methyltransferase A [Firmicutes bacterium]|nr:ribosomal RNA small subunit methyltransferase A [Bacillota bacterium]
MSKDFYKAKKALGQNFLIDDDVIEAIAKAAVQDPADTVLEIGPGRGALTSALCERAAAVKAVELDTDLIPVLRTQFILHPNVEIINADILRTDINALLAGSAGARSVVGNLPYYITTPVLMKFIEEDVVCDRITVMVQKEVAEKISAAPDSAPYGVLGVILQHFFSIEPVIEAPADCFRPRPKVDSAVIQLIPRAERAADTSESKLAYCSFVKAAFVQRRKTLANSLAGYAGRSKEDWLRAIEALGLSADVRPERLSPLEFAALKEYI